MSRPNAVSRRLKNGTKNGQKDVFLPKIFLKISTQQQGLTD
jgi:hypothetical protein